ncbi:MAG TPA: serine hydrolase [Blastocatellia bacterium]|nr:serine hydrolase [Blastocatellia bacterium]
MRTKLKTSARFSALVILLLCPALFAFESNDRENKIQQLIKESGAEMVGVAYFDLETGAEILINADENFHAASTMKVPVMMEVFRQDRKGKLSLNDYIPIKNDFISIADGTRFSISAESDSEQTLYNRIGQIEVVSELIHLMINVSSNLATNLLIERVTAPSVMEYMREIGARNIRVLRGVEDSKAYELGMNNTTTARDLMIILRQIARKQAVSSKASNEMVKILLEQKFNDGIPAGLPKEVKVAHKTGSITKINHDAAIVYPANRKPYVLVVLTRGIEDEKRANKLIADISRTIYKS